MREIWITVTLSQKTARLVTHPLDNTCGCDTFDTRIVSIDMEHNRQ
jgi:hypothetical protein